MSKKRFNAITLYHTDLIEKATLAPIGEYAKTQGYSITETSDFNQRSEIGIYCSHQHFPIHAQFSVICLHDLGQSHNRWPKFWNFESWHRFDIGFIPGHFWRDLYLTHSDTNHFMAPKKGLFVGGWPKSDFVFSDTFQSTKKELYQSYNFKHPKTILYAPSWENDNKQIECVDALKDLPCNILIKHAHWPKKYQHISDNIDRMEAAHKDKYDNVFFMDRKESIFKAIALSDMLVSDESGVMLEALILNKPSIACVDWKIPDTDPPRPASVPFDCVTKIQKNHLTATAKTFLESANNSPTESLSDHWFSHKGQAAKYTLSVINHFNQQSYGSHPDNLLKRSSNLLKNKIQYPIAQRIHFWKHNVRIH